MGAGDLLMTKFDVYVPSFVRNLVLSSVLTYSGAALAQEAATADPETGSESADSEQVEQIAESAGPGVVVTLDLGAQFNAETDFDSAVGEIQTTSYGADLGFLVPIDDRARLLLKVGVELTDYDITPPAGAAGTTAGTVGTQFDTVIEYGFDGLYTRAIDKERSFFVGGGIGFAGEGGASDALVWNALGGFAFQVNPKLRLGIGVGVFSQIEDDVRILPLPQISYTIDEYWSIRSEGPGARINYKWSNELSMGVQAKFDGQSFRIDSDNTLVPDGAVTMSGVPISYYIDYKGGESSRVSLFAEVGVTLAGSMEILNSSGNTVVDEDIDPSVFVGVGLKISF
jgi:hypothetical protein